jgi:hypothetical protein
VFTSDARLSPGSEALGFPRHAVAPRAQPLSAFLGFLDPDSLNAGLRAEPEIVAENGRRIPLTAVKAWDEGEKRGIVGLPDGLYLLSRPN